MSFLDEIGVVQESFSSDFICTEADTRDVGKLLMNKAYALEIDCDSDVTVFLDSDQICHSPFDLTNLSVPFVARRAFYPGAKAAENAWERAYQICDVKMPKHRIVARSRVKSDPVIVCPPYFNSGFLSVHRPWLHELVHNYRDCYRRIVENNLLGSNRYFEEQMALSIAVIKTDVPYELDNHRIDMSFLHYYSIPRLDSFKDRAKYAVELTRIYPALSEILSSDSKWSTLLNASERD